MLKTIYVLEGGKLLNVDKLLGVIEFLEHGLEEWWNA
jgi:hypothetical protein